MDNKILLLGGGAVWLPWTQPILTSNTSYGTVSASSSSSGSEPYKALNGVYSGTYTDTGQAWKPNSYSNTGWWMWQLPVKLLITAIDFYNAPDSGNWTGQTSQLFTSSAMTNPIGNSFTFAYNNQWTKASITGIPSTGITTNCIYYNKGGENSWNGIGELIITAKYLKV